MINSLTGIIQTIYDKATVLVAQGIGFHINIAQPRLLKKGSEATLYTYLHWNQEKGPTLYGFHEELERTVFLMIIECPKVGPAIALNILAQLQASRFLEIITSQDEGALHAINGIGAKTAEQLIINLKHKVTKLIASGTITAGVQQDFIHWQNITDVLTSLNYSRQEITGALSYLSQEYTEQNYSLDQLIRAALAYLSKSKAHITSK